MNLPRYGHAGFITNYGNENKYFVAFGKTSGEKYCNKTLEYLSLDNPTGDKFNTLAINYNKQRSLKLFQPLIIVDEERIFVLGGYENCSN